jgi:hypothetical protein
VIAVAAAGRWGGASRRNAQIGLAWVPGEAFCPPQRQRLCLDCAEAFVCIVQGSG